MKKQLCVLAGSLLLSSMALAQNMTCKVGTTVADKSGFLVPSDVSLTMTAKMNEASSLSQGLEIYFQNCTNQKLGRLELKFCASKTEFKGIYSAAIFVSGGSSLNDASVTSGNLLLGTLANGKGLDLIPGQGQDAVSPLIIEKLGAAGIEVPSEMRGDSLMVDEALREASKKNLLVGGEIVTLSLDKCEVR